MSFLSDAETPFSPGSAGFQPALSSDSFRTEISRQAASAPRCLRFESLTRASSLKPWDRRRPANGGVGKAPIDLLQGDSDGRVAITKSLRLATDKCSRRELPMLVIGVVVRGREQAENPLRHLLRLRRSPAVGTFVQQADVYCDRGHQKTDVLAPQSTTRRVLASITAQPSCGPFVAFIETFHLLPTRLTSQRFPAKSRE